MKIAFPTKLMNRSIVFLFIFVVVFSLVSASVVPLNGSNFPKKVTNGDDYWMLVFFSPTCPHCRNMTSAFNEASNMTKGLIKFGAVDCTKQENRSVCSQQDVSGFPTVKYFSPSTARFTAYNGNRDAKSFVRFAISSYESRIVKIKSEKELLGWMKSHDNELRFILHSTKKNPPILYKTVENIARKSKGNHNIALAFISDEVMDKSEVASTLKIDTPSKTLLVGIKPGKDGEIVSFNEPISNETIISWTQFVCD
eukprot:gnl/Carplike_NY0171/2622_a3524_608.p1 GENE.gnl/Carplike_NY0171/2622_a3524_608~~gnl/Carplike_NY0171/2622_a3524_608.p1  ORF type:complete len:254 (+),score=18.28 gnl/Carplike_NY0171/2622_a3524_608:28-789(+)